MSFIESSHFHVEIQFVFQNRPIIRESEALLHVPWPSLVVFFRQIRHSPVGDPILPTTEQLPFTEKLISGLLHDLKRKDNSESSSVSRVLTVVLANPRIFPLENKKGHISRRGNHAEHRAVAILNEDAVEFE